MDSVINWSMLREPYNWVIVILMLAIGVFALSTIQPQLASLRAGIGPVG